MIKSSSICHRQTHIYARIYEIFVSSPIERGTHRQQRNKFSCMLYYHKLGKIKFWLINKNGVKKLK